MGSLEPSWKIALIDTFEKKKKKKKKNKQTAD